MSKTPAEPSTGEREALEVVIDSFIEDYEMIGEDEAGRDGYYVPTDDEKALIKDAIMGLMSEDDFIAAYRTALAAQAPSPVAPSDAMFMAAVSALAEISVALGIPDDEAACANGNDLILERIAELHAAQAPSPASTEHAQDVSGWDPDQNVWHGPRPSPVAPKPVDLSQWEKSRFGVFLEDGRFEELPADDPCGEKHPRGMTSRWVGGAHDMQILRAALRAAIPDAPVAPSEPVHQWRTLNCADWYDGHPDHADDWGPYETRTLYTAPIQPRQAEPTCAGCNGNGEVGGLLSDGYHSEQCPFCHGSGVEPRQAPSDVLRKLHDAIHPGEKAPNRRWNAIYRDGMREGLKQAIAALGVQAPSDALTAIIAERAAQDAQWGGPEHDDQHDSVDWMRFIERQLYSMVGYRDARRQRFVKIAALAVAAVESIDRRAILSTQGDSK